MNILPSMREWYERERPKPEPRFTANLQDGIVAAGGQVKVYTPVTPLEARAIAAISPDRVSYCSGSGQKRFARQVQGASQLTDRQRQYLWAVVYKFRRQIRDRELVVEAKRIGGVT